MKFQRQTKILELIEKEPLETQEELSARLREAGFDTTQATVSRDIKELRLIKVMTADGTYRYATAAAEQEGGMQTRVRRIFRESVTSVAVAQNMVVIKTLPGLASAAGYAIDAMREPTVIGTLAGDDTVFCVMRDNEAAAEFRENALKLLA
ncbi:MAG: arginine repressor [Eubacteriales bacterium]|nr:arginine repressor [Clostridiales bacterium]MDY5016106.1 arginine repressor [Eubacteriales bacterium]